MTNQNTSNNSRKRPTAKQSSDLSTGQGTLPLDEVAIDISPYVTNVDQDIFAIQNLPEEFIAVLFAWVSRSPKSFKEHIADAIEAGIIDGEFKPVSTEKLDEKSKAFHEKWVVAYGHSSVAEHAIAHVGIEKVSRLASAELELSNEFYSITEYSQRYQKPERGHWHNPIVADFNNPDTIAIQEKFEKYFDDMYTSFEETVEAIYLYLKDQQKDLITDQSINNQMKHDEALKKIAFEDARYLLPLGMYTHLGMTANARSWRDGISKMMSSTIPEVRDIADSLKKEITKVIPTLLKHATPSEYDALTTLRTFDLFNNLPSSHFDTKTINIFKGPSEKEMIISILTDVISQERNIDSEASYTIVQSMSEASRISYIKTLLLDMNVHDKLPKAFEHVHFKVSFVVSEACWHQLLRHNRRSNFTYGFATTQIGEIVPPNIIAAGLELKFREAIARSKEFFNELTDQGHDVTSQYVVTNASLRHIVGSFSLQEVYHLINLRTSPEAQWEIKNAFEDLHHLMTQLYPTLLSAAKRR